MTRQCSNCQLCCRLLPLAEFQKPANQRCSHQHFRKGCAIYSRRPSSCAIWSCRWLIEDDTADLSRPDRAGYVIDALPDFITIRHNDTGEELRIEVVQVWIDPHRPDAHKDPAFRSYLERRGEEGKAALIRFDAMRAMILFPPALTGNGEWYEAWSACEQQQHSAVEIADVLGLDSVRSISKKLLGHAING